MIDMIFPFCGLSASGGAAIDAAVPVPVLSTALYERFSSRGEATFGDKLLSAMRYEFGGHVEKTAG
jgi:6-phosphogluconate dehydrogenase